MARLSVSMRLIGQLHKCTCMHDVINCGDCAEIYVDTVR